MHHSKHKAFPASCTRSHTSLGFTLVELIVVVTILAILATIGFVSYSSYLTGVRDTNRLAQLVSIHDWLELYRTKKDLPLPDESVEVKTNWKIIWYQWYAGSLTLETIDFTKWWKDPKDKVYFSYYITSDRKELQLLALLEEENSFTFLPVEKTIAVDYENRSIVVYWNELWILVWQGNIPIQEIPSLWWVIDLQDVWIDVYSAIIKEDDVITWSGTELAISNPKANCKRLRQIKWSLASWKYVIDPRANGVWFEVYCDMETAWWGWTIVAKTWLETTATISWECWPSLSIPNLDEEDMDYLIHCDVWQEIFLVNQVNTWWVVWWSPWVWQIDNDCSVNATKTWLNQCDWVPEILMFSVLDSSSSLRQLDPIVTRIWRVWDNNLRDDNYIYNIIKTWNVWIWNSNNTTSDLSWPYTWNNFWYIWVR